MVKKAMTTSKKKEAKTGKVLIASGKKKEANVTGCKV